MIFSNNGLWAVLLFGIVNSALALPLAEDVDLTQTSHSLLKPDSGGTELLQLDGLNEVQQGPKTVQSNQSIFSEEDINSSDIDLLPSTDYFEDSESRNRQGLYAETYNSGNRNAPARADRHNRSVDNASLLSGVVIEPELKDKIKDSLASLKEVKEVFVADKEISYESAGSETETLIQRNLYLQEQQRLDELKGINNKVTKEKYTSSMFREFIGKVISFVLYAVLGIILIKLLMMFIAWQRKLNQF